MGCLHICAALTSATGAGIATVLRLVRHATISTTQRYDRWGEAAKSQTAERLYVPDLT